MLVICRKASKRRQQIPDHPLVKVLELNMEEYETYQPPEGEMPYDVFYHFAWGGTTGDGRNDCEIQEKNIRYALDAAALAKRFGCSAFVGAGSQAEYGRVEGNLNSQTPAFPENGYGMAKLCAGQMTRLYCRQAGMRHVWTRILSIYGPGDGAGSMVMSAIHRLLAGETPAFTKGEQQWDYLYSGDAAKALLLLGEKGHDGGVYCLGSGKARPLADYIGMIRDAIDPRLSVALGAVPYAPGQVMYLCADIAKLKEDTGFAPEVSFEEGIKKTIMWVKEHG